jgi:hypothetical protein
MRPPRRQGDMLLSTPNSEEAKCFW